MTEPNSPNTQKLPDLLHRKHTRVLSLSPDGLPLLTITSAAPEEAGITLALTGAAIAPDDLFADELSLATTTRVLDWLLEPLSPEHARRLLDLAHEHLRRIEDAAENADLAQLKEARAAVRTAHHAQLAKEQPGHLPRIEDDAEEDTLCPEVLRSFRDALGPRGA